MEDIFDWQKILLTVKEKIKEEDFGEYRKKGVYRMWGLCRPNDKDDFQDSAIDYVDILTKAIDDPCPLIRRNAAEELEKLKQKQER